MTENERQEMLKDIRDGYIDAWDNLTIDELFKQIEKEHEEIQQYRAIGTIEEFKQAMNFKKYFMELYDEGLEVANWHKNGDLEPLVNFIDDACN